MRTLGEEALQPRFGVRHRVRPRHADRVEAARSRALDQRAFDVIRIGQKSRSA
jgi:hypothetical protein